jgi:ElaB/YqjD/DUF883 family membrane-anchored ribosome-binding protein
MSTADRASENLGDQQDKSPEELRRDIEETREQLGDTVEALAEKSDVKAQAKRRVDSLKDSARQAQARAKAAAPDSANAGAQQVATAVKQNPLPVAAGAAFFLGVVFGRRMAR